VLGAVGVVVVGAIAMVLLLGSGDDGTPSRPASAAVQRLTVGSAPRSIAAGTGGVWVANSGAATVSRIAPRRGVVQQAAVAAVPQPFGVAVDEERLWVVGPSGRLAQLDARTGQRLRTAELADQADGLAAGFGALWVINATAGTVTRIDVSSGRIGARRTVTVGTGTTDIAAGPAGVWVTNSSSATVVQLNPANGVKLRTVQLRGLVGGVALDDSGVWVANPGRGQLVRVDPRNGATREIRLAPTSHVADVAAGDGAVFYVDGETGNATRVDPATRKRVGSPVRVAVNPGGAVVAGRSLWVTDTGRGTVARLRF
jgi:streptogramin lyase